MTRGNLTGLPLNMVLFSGLALLVTAGSAVVYGENLVNPTQILERADSAVLSIIAAITFFAATVGIDLVANYIVSLISEVGIGGLVNTLGATLYGIMIFDYYPLRKQKLIVNDLYSTNPEASYAYIEGWNRRAVIAFIVGAAFSVATVWVDALSILSGYAWLLGRPAWWRHLLCNGGVIE